MRVRGFLPMALALSLSAAGAAAQSPVASPSPDQPRPELLASTTPGLVGRDRLVLLRTTLEPGQQLGGVGWGGSNVSWVQSGELSLLVDAGTVMVGPPGGGGGMVADGDSATIPALSTIRGGSETVMTWTNDADVRTIILTSAIIPELGGDPTSLSGGSPGPEVTPGPKGAPPIVRTIVLRGTGPVGQPATYTIRDQSGWVVGARVPDEQELRGWPRELFGATPVRATGRDTFDLLVSWSGGGCGPTITLTVGPRLRSMRLVDRSPGCDASAMGHWLVLELRSTAGLPVRDIPFESVRRVR